MHLGLLYLTILTAVHNTLLATTFIPSSNPGALPDIPVRSTAVKIAAFWYSHTTAVVLFGEYNRTEKVLRQQLLLAVDERFVRSVRHRYVGYGTLVAHGILMSFRAGI